MLLVCLFAHAAREYVESFEGCEGLADRLALQAETGQDQVCVLKMYLKISVIRLSKFVGLFSLKGR